MSPYTNNQFHISMTYFDILYIVFDIKNNIWVGGLLVNMVGDNTISGIYKLKKGS